MFVNHSINTINSASCVAIAISERSSSMLQGLCVSCLFCFANHDVHQAIRVFIHRQVHATRWRNYCYTGPVDSAGVYVINSNSQSNNLALIWQKRKSTPSIRTTEINVRTSGRTSVDTSEMFWSEVGRDVVKERVGTVWWENGRGDVSDADDVMARTIE